MLVPHVTLSTAELQAFRASRVSIAVRDAVFRVEGNGAISCLQGLLTNDVDKLGNGLAAWGAFLTPKGMIITDAWIVRDGASAWVVVPRSAHDTVRHLFARSLPPRLATVSDRSDSVQVRWLCGLAPAAGEGMIVARPEGSAPFTTLLLTEDVAAVDARLDAQGWLAADESRADFLKLLMGWPSLGREIDERTLPQEVRFDELGGVKYDKGCYTGQETVARLHFRGHANRTLRGLRWAPGEAPNDTHVFDGDKEVGTIRTLAMVEDECIALAMLRREIEPGDMLRTGNSEGVVVDPPFEIGAPAVA